MLVWMCSNVFTMFAGFCGHAVKTTFAWLNTYNWLFESKHNADMALCENEFDRPAVQQNERRSRLALYLTNSEMVLRLPADFMAIYIFPRFDIFYCQDFLF